MTTSLEGWFFGALFLVSLIGLSSLPFLRMLWRSEIEACRYSLFEVRDRLVILVAKNELSRDSEIFRYYYPRINRVLRMTEKVHLEGLIQFLLSNNESKEEFDKDQDEFNEVIARVTDSPEDVKRAIEQYYSTLRDSLIISSNFFNVVFLISRHYGRIAERLQLFQWAQRREPRIASAYDKLRTESRLVGVSV